MILGLEMKSNKTKPTHRFNSRLHCWISLQKQKNYVILRLGLDTFNDF